jgi:hypothetical protein
MERWDSELFLERLKAGKFDDHLFEAISQLSSEELGEVAEILREEERTKARVN